MQTTPDLADAINAYESAFTNFLDGIQENGDSVRGAIATNEPFNDAEDNLDALAEAYLETSNALSTLLVNGADEDDYGTPFFEHGRRRLMALAAGDFLAGEALSLLAATTPAGIPILQTTLFEGPSIAEVEILDRLRGGEDPFDVLLQDIRNNDLPSVIAGVSGMSAVRGGADSIDNDMERVKEAINQVVKSGADTIERTVLAGIFTLDGAGISSHIATFLSGSFDNTEAGRGIRWLVKKVCKIFSAARDKIVHVIGAGWLSIISDVFQEAVDWLKRGVEQRLLRSTLQVHDLERECQSLLDGITDPSDRSNALDEVCRVPEHCDDMERWARYGATGIRIARALQMFVAGGLLWPILLAISAGLSGYGFWVVQDHLDWPTWKPFPQYFPGVRLTLETSGLTGTSESGS